MQKNYKVAELEGVPVVAVALARTCDGPMCSDLDNECPDVLDKVACWLHAPELGLCPYLQRETP